MWKYIRNLFGVLFGSLFVNNQIGTRVGGNGGTTGEGFPSTINFDENFDPSKNQYDLMPHSSGSSGSSGSFNSSDGFNLSGLVGALINRLTAERLTGAEIEANQWSAQQAQLGRDWQEYFYNQYQSPLAQVRQSREAGLNPALMYGNGVSAPSAVASSAPSSVSPQGSQVGLMNLLEMVSNLAMRRKEMQADLDLKSANAYRTRAEGDLIHHNIDAFGERLERERGRFNLDLALTNKRIEEIDSNIKVNYAQEQGLLQGVNESKAREAVAKMDAALKKVDLQTRSDFNNASLACLNAQRSLDIARTKLTYAEGRKSEKELELLKIRVDNAQTEYDLVFKKMKAEINNISKQAGLTDKEIEYFEDKYNLQVISTVTGAVNAAKFAPGTRFSNGSLGFNRFLGDMGTIASKAGRNLLK